MITVQCLETLTLVTVTTQQSEKMLPQAQFLETFPSQMEMQVAMAVKYSIVVYLCCSDVS